MTAPGTPDDASIEAPTSHSDVTTIMRLISDIQIDVRKIRELMEDDEDGEEEEVPEAD